MKLKYTYTLFTLITVLYFVPANAQKKTTTKKPAAKTTKPAAKPVVIKKTDAKSLGEAASKVSVKDTVKGGGLPLIHI